MISVHTAPLPISTLMFLSQPSDFISFNVVSGFVVPASSVLLLANNPSLAVPHPLKLELLVWDVSPALLVFLSGFSPSI
jgi:hypothetical protein